MTPSNNIIKEMNPKRNEQGIEREKKFIEDLSVRKRERRFILDVN